MSAEDALAALEAKVLSGAAGGWLNAIDELRTMLAMESPGIKAKMLELVAPTIEPEALAAVRAAFGLGKADALSIIESSALDVSTQRLRPSKAASAPISGLDEAAKAALAKARQLAQSGAEPNAYLSPLFQHATATRRDVGDAINRAGNEGTTAVADKAGLPTVWVAETNACVHCLAYSGRTVKPGETFPGGLTYGKKSYYPDAVKTPPRHPHCRCTVEPLVAQEYADALRREADRSVLRGFSLESESMGTRVDAAKRLVDKGVDAPASVIKYAERSIKAGKFPTRDRPNGAGPTPGPGPVPPNKRPPGAPKPPADAAADKLAKTKAELAKVQAERAALAARQKVLDERLAKLRAESGTPELDKMPKLDKPIALRKAAGTANPGAGVRAYDNNCSNCVTAAELRARGYDVIATKVPGRKGRITAEITAQWKDADGNSRPFGMNKTRKEVELELEAWPNGARGFVAVQWSKTRSGHIYSVTKTSTGEIVYLEPQDPKDVFGAKGHLDRAISTKIGLLRVDDLTPSDALSTWVEPNTPATIVKLEAAAAKKAALKAELDAAWAEYTRLDAASKVYFGADGVEAYRAAVLAKNEAAAIYNELRKRYLRT